MEKLKLSIDSNNMHQAENISVLFAAYSLLTESKLQITCLLYDWGCNNQLCMYMYVAI